MTESSRPWAGIVTGDSGPYSDAEWSDTWASFFGPTLANQGVFRNQLNELNLSGVATPISVNSGRAIVDGTWYESTAAETFAIGTPATARIDIVVLRKTFASQIVRLAVLTGTPGASPSPPALTQDGVTWETAIWKIHITSGGVITIIADDRHLLGNYEANSLTKDIAYVDDDFWEGENYADAVNRRIWTPKIDAGAGNSIIPLLEAGFSSGGIALAHGAGTGDEVSISSFWFRPDQINARLLVINKEPNTDGNLDRVIGFVSAGSDLTPVHGVFFRADGAGNWFAVNRAGGVETPTDTLIGLTDVWKNMEIRVAPSGAVFLIDDAVVATHFDNTPSDIALFLTVSVFDNGVAPASQAYQHLDAIRVKGIR